MGDFLGRKKRLFIFTFVGCCVNVCEIHSGLSKVVERRSPYYTLSVTDSRMSVSEVFCSRNNQEQREGVFVLLSRPCITRQSSRSVKFNGLHNLHQSVALFGTAGGERGSGGGGQGGGGVKNDEN